MNSRERIHHVLSHVQTDTIPIDFGGHRSNGIAAMAHTRLKRALGVSLGYGFSN